MHGCPQEDHHVAGHQLAFEQPPGQDRFLLEQADVHGWVAFSGCDHRMQHLDPSPARVVARGGQLGVHRRGGFVGRARLWSENQVQHPPDFCGFDLQAGVFPAHAAFLHDLDQAARIDGDLGEVGAGGRQEQVEEAQPHHAPGNILGYPPLFERGWGQVDGPEGRRHQGADAARHLQAFHLVRRAQEAAREFAVHRIDDLVQDGHPYCGVQAAFGDGWVEHGHDHLSYSPARILTRPILNVLRKGSLPRAEP